jgi:hypothetical protein
VQALEANTDMYLALRTQSTIAILSARENRIEVRNQLDLAEKFVRANSKISCMEFVTRPVKHE